MREREEEDRCGFCILGVGFMPLNLLHRKLTHDVASGRRVEKKVGKKTAPYGAHLG